ncbi:MAG: Bro-N domain-containing protein [Fibromonadales bacterium]|nr:Bro-N domain-containing protein [Fibromonadales bacterium]
MEKNIQMFEGQRVRSVWDEEAEKWWFSVLDVVAVLTDQADYAKVRSYWKWLKNKLIEEGHNEVVSNTNHLKLEAPDGKMRFTDLADTEQLFRLIQSIPSKKAEPFKMWLARVGKERIDETIDPEQSIERAIQNYRKLGYSESWINQRIKSIEVRKALTDEWDKAGVKQGEEYAYLTDLMTKTWSGMTTKQYKKHKNLKKENLRDNMSNLELIVNMLAEATATELSAKSSPKDLTQSASVAKKGAIVARNTRIDIEKQGGKVISSQSAKQLGRIKTPKTLSPFPPSLSSES